MHHSIRVNHGEIFPLLLSMILYRIWVVGYGLYKDEFIYTFFKHVFLFRQSVCYGDFINVPANQERG